MLNIYKITNLNKHTMKIFIISNGFTGATLPLANSFALAGNKVKCLYIVEGGTKCIESLDFDAPIPMHWGKMVELSKKNRLYNYLDLNVDVSFMPTWKHRRRLEKIGIGKIFPILNSFLMKAYIKQIISEKPDVVNLVVHTEKEAMIAKKLKEVGIPFTITYHEVLHSLVGKESLRKHVLQTFKLDTPIICHSKKTAADLVNNVSGYDVKKHINLIHFGPFDSYKAYGKGFLPNGVPDKYLLYLGHIHPYKGLKYLFDAVEFLGEKIGSVKIVVAGNGYDPILDKMKKNSRFMLINRFIENAELVGLIRNCSAIICPYISASQSGLVQTGMVFNKPIVATRVGSFIEIIHDGVNGILCEAADAKSLANAINRVISNEVTFNSIDIPAYLKWDNIANKYMELYRKMVQVPK